MISTRSVISQSGMINLRRDYARFCGVNDNQPQLKKIMMVGAITEDNAEYCLSDSDLGFFARTIRTLYESGMHVHPEFEIDIVNIDENCGGRDFLRETTPADLVMLCFLFNPSKSYTDSAGYPNMGFYAISDKHYLQNAWNNAALTVDAKVISIYGDDVTEVGPDAFLRADNNQYEIRVSAGSTIKPTILVRKP